MLEREKFRRPIPIAAPDNLSMRLCVFQAHFHGDCVAVAYKTDAFRDKAMTALCWINTSSCRVETAPRVSLTAAASRTRALCACTPASQSKQVQITRQHRALRQIAVCRSTAVDTAEAEGVFVAFQSPKTFPHSRLQHRAVPCRS